MVRYLKRWQAIAVALALISPFTLGPDRVSAEPLSHGDDVYLAGDDVVSSGDIPRNLYVAGGAVDVEKDVARNAHIVGFNVDIDAPIGGDLYTAGAFLDIGSAVGGDVSAGAFRLRLSDESSVGGNMRAAARTVVLGGTLSGAALIAAERLELNGTVAGDLKFTGRSITFGPDARVSGILTAATPHEPDVPASVAPADRVRHEPFTPPDFAHSIGKGAAEGAGEAIGLSAPAWWIIAAAVAAFFIGLILLGILFLGLAPQTVENLREDAERHLFRSFGFGLLGLATLLGLLPLAVVTLVGLPLIPVILLTIGFLAVFAYLLGSYVLAHRVFRSFGAAHATMAGRLRTFVVGLVVLLALNAVPLIGWLINAFAALVGFGALEMRLVRLLSRSSQRPPREAEPAAPSA